MGFFESTFNPCLITITVQWYKREEQPIVSAIWQSMFAFGTTIQSLIAYGMFNVRDTSLRNWQWVVLIFAMLSAIGTGETVLLPLDKTEDLPDSPYVLPPPRQSDHGTLGIRGAQDKVRRTGSIQQSGSSGQKVEK
jgi:MFS family permease